MYVTTLAVLFPIKITKIPLLYTRMVIKKNVAQHAPHSLFNLSNSSHYPVNPTTTQGQLNLTWRTYAYSWGLLPIVQLTRLCCPLNMIVTAVCRHTYIHKSQASWRLPKSFFTITVNPRFTRPLGGKGWGPVNRGARLIEFDQNMA